MKYVFLNLFLWSISYGQAMSADTLHHVRFVSAADSSPLGFTGLKAWSSGIMVASWETNADGYTGISRKEISRYAHVLITVRYPGFENLSFKADTLALNDTLTIAMKPKLQELEEIQIVAYTVPQVEKEQPVLRYGRHKAPEKTTENVSVNFPRYTPRQCIAYEALQQGVWLAGDTAAWNGILAWDTLNGNYTREKDASLAREIMHYFQANITYPDQARDFCMQEKVYVWFELDAKGSVHYIRVAKGNHIDLVLEVANALARMPRVALTFFFPDVAKAGQRKPLRPLCFCLPVKFILK